MPQGGEFKFHGQFDSLFEAIMEKFGVIFAKIAQHPKVGAIHLGDVHKGEVFIAALFYFPGTEHAATVGIDQYGYYELRGVGMLTYGAIAAFDGRCIKLLEQVAVEITFMLFREQIENITGKQKVLVKFYRA
jgi:hypothetical protein